MSRLKKLSLHHLQLPKLLFAVACCLLLMIAELSLAHFQDQNNRQNNGQHNQQQPVNGNATGSSPQTKPEPPPRRQQAAEDEYLIGVGIGDITGPAADINLMGYAKPNQDAGGIHLRQFSRSIIIEDLHGSRILYISIDNGMISQLLRSQVLNRLKLAYGQQVFNESNVMMSATHSHSCPGGFFQYMLYNIPSSGFISQTLEALVEGIVRSVDRASESMKPAKIYYNEGELLDASVNRSPTSYLNNPIEERAKYKHDTDKGMSLLKMVDLESGEPIAMLNWFAVHGTSMNNTNHLISGDNKGYASLLFEEEFNPAGTLPGKGKFVAIFAQANEGDVSPNTRGPRCVDSGLPCDMASSTCGNPARVQRLDKQRKQQREQQAALLKQQQQQRPQSLENHMRNTDAASQRQPIGGGTAFGRRSKRSALREWMGNPFRAGWRKKSGASAANVEAATNSRSSSSASLQQQQQQQQSEPSEKCIAFGPGKDMFESTKIIAYKQYFKARQLFLDQSSEIRISGPVRFIHEHIDISRQVVPLYEAVSELARRQYPNPLIAINSSYLTCPAALGYSFAAGTTDGPGAFDFQQGDTASTRYWNMVRDFLRRPSEAQIECHRPKPIILSTGEMEFPYMWHPKIVPTQILQLGQLAIVGLPGEFTTMAGRRVRQSVHKILANERQPPPSHLWAAGPNQRLDDSDGELITTLQDLRGTTTNQQRSKRSTAGSGDSQQQLQVNQGGQANQIKVVLSGLSNIYTSYVTTLEEYEVQRYEGASTLYGPHTLQAYVNQFAKLALHLASGRPLEPPASGLEPPDLTKSLFTLKAGVIYDGAQHGRSFGDVLEEANSTYKCADLVRVSFVAGNPRNDLRQEDSFLYVDRYTGGGGSASGANWTTVATDSSWETKFIWERTNTLMGESKAIVEWEIPSSCQPGVYRIRHYGAHKSILQTVSQYSGQSRPFKVMGGSKSDQVNQQQQQQLDRLLDSAIESIAAEAAASAAAAAATSAEIEKRRTSSNHHYHHRKAAADSSDRAKAASIYSPFSLIGSWFGWNRN